MVDDVNYAAMDRSMTEDEKRQTGPTIAPSFQYLYKPLTADGTKTAVLLMNQGNAPVDLTLDFADVPGLKCTTCKVRDIWNHKDLGSASGSFVAKNVGSHDCAFLIISSESEENSNHVVV